MVSTYGQGLSATVTHDTFTQMYNQFKGMVISVVREKLGETSIPDTSGEDVSQEVFLQLWRSLQNGVSIEYPRSFIKGITYHCISDAYEKRFKCKQRHTSLKTEEYSIEQYLERASSDTEMEIDCILDEGLESNDNVEETALKNEFKDVCVRIIQSLPHEHWKQVVYLNRIEGYSYPEISNVLNIPLEKVKGYGKRGFKILETELKKIFSE